MHKHVGQGETDADKKIKIYKKRERKTTLRIVLHSPRFTLHSFIVYSYPQPQPHQQSKARLKKECAKDAVGTRSIDSLPIQAGAAKIWDNIKNILYSDSKDNFIAVIAHTRAAPFKR